MTNSNSRIRSAGFAAAVGGAALLAATTAQAVDVNYSMMTAPDSIQGRIGEMWAAYADVASGGDVNIKVFPNGQLGKERAQLEGLVVGTHQTFTHISAITGKFPEVRFWDLPFLFTSIQQVSRVVGSPMRAELEQALDCQGMVYLATVGYGYRQFTIRNKAYNSPADLVGQKHRIPGGKSKQMLFEALGANVSTVAFVELYQGLGSGVVDSQDNPLGIIYTSKFHEVTNYLSVLNYNYNPNLLIGSKVWFEKLTPEQQKVLKDAAIKLEGWSIMAADKDDAEYLVKIQQDKPAMKVNYLDEKTLPQWREKAKPVYEAFREENGKAWSDAVFKLIDGGHWDKPGKASLASCK
ncbi:MAG: TRAP transporter substrate-binding protein [Alphaproteobacteria bacterium]